MEYSMVSLKEIQAFELQMLKDVVKVCEKYNITYFLVAGNLLGAVRHGGFIPWDDDVDIDMPLKDYKRFLKVAQKEFGDKYFVQNYKTEKNYGEMWTQIRANNTTSMPIELINYDINFGMCLDIFPIIGIPSDDKKAKKQKKALALNRLLLHDTYAKAVNETINKKEKLIYKFPRSLRRLFCKINEHNYMINPEESDKWIELWFSIDNSLAQPKELLEKVTMIKFENDDFNTFQDYDLYLTNLYGDYMTPPPENERGGHSDTLGKIIFDLNKSYLDYKKELLNK